jgi:hypothetical protein
MMIIVKAVNELLSVNVLLIGGTAVPQVGVGIDHKDFLSGFGSVHSA